MQVDLADGSWLVDQCTLMIAMWLRMSCVAVSLLIFAAMVMPVQPYSNICNVAVGLRDLKFPCTYINLLKQGLRLRALYNNPSQAQVRRDQI